MAHTENSGDTIAVAESVVVAKIGRHGSRYSQQRTWRLRCSVRVPLLRLNSIRRTMDMVQISFCGPKRRAVTATITHCIQVDGVDDDDDERNTWAYHLSDCLLIRFASRAVRMPFRLFIVEHVFFVHLSSPVVVRQISDGHSVDSQLAGLWPSGSLAHFPNGEERSRRLCLRCVRRASPSDCWAVLAFRNQERNGANCSEVTGTRRHGKRRRRLHSEIPVRYIV